MFPVLRMSVQEKPHPHCSRRYAQVPARHRHLGKENETRVDRDTELIDVNARKQMVSPNNRMDQKLPSMALDSVIPAGVKSFGYPHILVYNDERSAWVVLFRPTTDSRESIPNKRSQPVRIEYLLLKGKKITCCLPTRLLRCHNQAHQPARSLIVYTQHCHAHLQ